MNDAPTRLGGQAAENQSLFVGLPERVREQLLAVARPVALRAGEWLFEADADADALYVVRGGRLEVVAANQVVRELGRDEIVGELAILSGAPRSAGVRARRDSSLLRIEAEDFRSALDADVAAQHAVTAALAAQLQRSRSLEDEASIEPRVISLIGASPNAPVEPAAALLVEALGRQLKVVAPGRVGIEELDRAERDNDRVVLVASAADSADWRRFCLRQADRLVVVANADSTTMPLTLDRVSYVVLVGGPPERAGLLAWHDAAGPRHVLACRESELGAAVGSVAARLAGQSLGVALAGGGARAFAAIGVLHELEDAGHEVNRISGTSVGGVIAALYATGQDAGAVDAACYEEFVRRNPFRDYTVPRVAISRGRKAEAALRRRLGDLHFEELPRELALVSTDMLDHSAVVHRRGLVRDAVRASLSLPGLFPPARLAASLHIDGGVLDNLPVGALHADEGPILAVNISPGGRLSRGSEPPRMPSLPETLLRSMMMGSAGAVAAGRRQAAVVVTPDTRGIGLLEFHQIDRAVEAGRAAGRAALEALAARSLQS